MWNSDDRTGKSSIHIPSAAVRLTRRVFASLLAAVCAASFLTAGAAHVKAEGAAPAVTLGLEGPVGMIFYAGQPISVTLVVSGTGTAAIPLNVRFEAKSSAGVPVGSGSLAVTAQAGSESRKKLTLPQVKRCDVYHLAVTAVGSNVSIQKTFSFSRVLLNESTSPDVFAGVGTHFNQKKATPEINLSIAASGGSGWIRDEMSWDQAETVKGRVDVLPAWDDYVASSAKRHQQILLVLDYGNKFCDDGNAPCTDEGIAAYARYAAAMAQHFKGKIDHFEIWNEYDNKGFNRENQPPEMYEKMLAAAYRAIKTVSPKACVIGGATAGADLDWLARVLRRAASM